MAHEPLRLRERGAEVLGPEELNLDQAARRGFVTRVRDLLPAATPQERGDALVSAVQKENGAVARAIAEYGGIEDHKLVLALGQCIAFDVPEVVPSLIAAGVDRDSPENHYDAPPIVLAADRGRVSIVRDLLAGVDLQRRDKRGRNAIAAARDRGQTEIVRMLQAAGATARTPAAIAKATRQKLAAGARSTWAPQLGGTAATGDASRFGLPSLRSNEGWPACGDCRAPLTFFVQVDLSRTPKAAREVFGVGLLQLFHCTACNPSHPFSSGHRVRIVDPADAVTDATKPKGAHVLPERPITGWARAVKDYPCREADESALLPEERAVVFTLNRQGDKLGGWPNWVQDPDYPRCPHGGHRMTQPVLQIDSHHGVAHMWGDNGVGFIVQCPQHRDAVTFLWQCA
ncbi:hypothetical protein Misp01_64810 [Microtetraspora sp. NBRC 13810]|uniref:DUF1963 domain-containing protein n=1 Tax=Microtetraspora sp. NBRC 13810 TaxID=3030990 RepID=UPI0024A4582C|nr:DUF1963 domain-containing protein [Microtetraspora sp. NBRC 13810]GLW11353.1 hypothetical protein Misp01_64810 [Microtetraspora sp. NBRC 13810]